MRWFAGEAMPEPDDQAERLWAAVRMLPDKRAGCGASGLWRRACAWAAAGGAVACAEHIGLMWYPSNQRNGSNGRSASASREVMTIVRPRRTKADLTALPTPAPSSEGESPRACRGHAGIWGAKDGCVLPPKGNHSGLGVIARAPQILEWG